MGSLLVAYNSSLSELYRSKSSDAKDIQNQLQTPTEKNEVASKKDAKECPAFS